MKKPKTYKCKQCSKDVKIENGFKYFFSRNEGLCNDCSFEKHREEIIHEDDEDQIFRMVKRVQKELNEIKVDMKKYFTKPISTLCEYVIVNQMIKNKFLDMTETERGTLTTLIIEEYNEDLKKEQKS